MKTKLQSCLKSLKKFHKDEEGMESVQVVAIVAVAAFVLIFVKTVLWPSIKDYTTGKVDELQSD